VLRSISTFWNLIAHRTASTTVSATARASGLLRTRHPVEVDEVGGRDRSDLASFGHRAPRTRGTITQRPTNAGWQLWIGLFRRTRDRPMSAGRSGLPKAALPLSAKSGHLRFHKSPYATRRQQQRQDGCFARSPQLQSGRSAERPDRLWGDSGRLLMPLADDALKRAICARTVIDTKPDGI
jgi:hypothetical protein